MMLKECLRVIGGGFGQSLALHQATQAQERNFPSTSNIQFRLNALEIRE